MCYLYEPCGFDTSPSTYGGSLFSLLSHALLAKMDGSQDGMSNV